MKLIKRINNPQFILLAIFFILLSISYTTNIFRISEPELFHGFERQPEGLVVGRLARSAQDGIFSYGGLTGVNYSSTSDRTTEQYIADLAAQHSIYINNIDIPDKYQAYKSQSGGQGITMSFIQKALPFDNAKKLMFFRAINALLVALVFCVFASWIYRNFGFFASFATLTLTLLSPWLNMYSHNLWWMLWNFYLPFLSMLLVLEQRHKNPAKWSELKVFAILFGAILTKCFFSGFEFITTTLVSAICPIAFYFYLEKKTLIQFILFSIKASITMIAGVLVQMLMLVVQIGSIENSLGDGMNHIINSFTKRTEEASISHLEVFKTYFQGDSFSLGFLPNKMEFYFGFLIFLLIIISIVVFFKKNNNRKNKALIVTFAFSILAPLSWLIVFKQHAYWHSHMDYIIWYMPFLLYGYALIGICFSNVLAKRN